MKLNEIPVEILALPFVIVRGRDSGVHAGFLRELEKETKSVRLAFSRRMWGWTGGKTLSELAVFGPSEPGKCHFGCVVPDIWIVGDACEVIFTTDRARRIIIDEVPSWE